jgi:hypothetical protein
MKKDCTSRHVYGFLCVHVALTGGRRGEKFRYLRELSNANDKHICQLIRHSELFSITGFNHRLLNSFRQTSNIRHWLGCVNINVKTEYYYFLHVAERQTPR